MHGKITRDDYRKLLEPMEEMFASDEKVSVLVQLEDYDGMECGAMWDDLKFGFKHAKNMRRMAVVTDRKWMETLTKVMNPLFSAKIRPFPTEEESEAWEWVVGDE